ncbi:MAG: DUF1552 domain-containing protein [Vicinamibacterales bacterium]
MFVTRKQLSRRTVLKGMGATMALPLLDAMTPAFGGQGKPEGLPPRNVRLVCIEMVHGAAGSSQFGFEKNLWAPAAEGRDFDLGPTSLKPLEPFRDHLTIISNTDVPSANATEAREIGGDHFRSTAVFLTQSYPKRTEGADVEVGTSFDQLYAQRFGRDTTIPSMQVSIESVDEGGGCQYGYSCAYADSLSWASPRKPLPMVRDPRVVFDQLFGMFKKDGTPAEQRERLAENRSMLDWLLASSNRLRSRLGATDRARLDEYLENVRELERRIQRVEAFNRSGEVRELPGAPAGIPDSYSEHVKLMFDLQLLAFTSDVTRVFSFKLSRDGSNRVFPESGFNGPFHNSSHHSARETRILDFARINTYHVGLLPYFLQKLKDTPDGDGTLLDNSLVMYGSPMGDPNFHNHKRVPFIVAGHAGGALKGGVHLKAPNRTPLANVMLSLLHSLGLDDLKTFGDSEGAFPLS